MWGLLLLACVVLTVKLRGYHMWYPSLHRMVFSESVRELDAVRKAVNARTDKDVRFYHESDQNMSSLFYGLLKTKGVTQQEIKRLITGQLPVMGLVKALFNRPRPYQLDSTIQPPASSDTYHTPAYPAGHAWQAYLVAKHFSKRFPELGKELYGLADRIDEVRVQMGVHYPSDGTFSKTIVNLFYPLLARLAST